MEKGKNSFSITIGVMIFLFIVVVALAIGVGLGYIEINLGQKVDSEKVNNIHKEETAKESIKIDDTKGYVYLYKSKEIRDISFKGIIEIPYININTEEIKKLNKELEERYNKYVSEITVTDVEQGYGKYTNFEYEDYLANEILSVLIKTKPIKVPSGGMVDTCETYNIDIKTGELISNSQLLEKFDATEEQLNQKIKIALEEKYNEWNSSDINISLSEFMETTKYGIEQPMYVNDEGKLIAIASYPSMMGDNCMVEIK